MLEPAQFFAFAAVLMRRILVDHAKGHLAAKRGKGLANLPLDEAIGVRPNDDTIGGRDVALEAAQKAMESARFLAELGRVGLEVPITRPARRA